MTKSVKIRVATAEDYSKRSFWTVGTFHRAAVPLKKAYGAQDSGPAAPAADASTKTDSTGGKRG
jgi:hypothetical protein